MPVPSDPSTERTRGLLRCLVAEKFSATVFDEICDLLTVPRERRVGANKSDRAAAAIRSLRADQLPVLARIVIGLDPLFSPGPTPERLRNAEADLAITMGLAPGGAVDATQPLASKEIQASPPLQALDERSKLLLRKLAADKFTASQLDEIGDLLEVPVPNREGGSKSQRAAGLIRALAPNRLGELVRLVMGQGFVMPSPTSDPLRAAELELAHACGVVSPRKHEKTADEQLLEACAGVYEQSPTMWATWHGDPDDPAFDALDRAARRLQAKGLIEATLTGDRTIVHAKLTEFGHSGMSLSRGRYAATVPPAPCDPSQETWSHPDRTSPIVQFEAPAGPSVGTGPVVLEGGAPRVRFRWLHISDTHFGHGDARYRWDQRLVVDALLDDVRKHVKKEPIDAIFLTGDVAFSGGGRPGLLNAEYTNAAAWLGRLAELANVPRDRVFLVAGNHDIDRGVDNDIDTLRLVEDLRGTPRPGRTLDTSLEHPTDWQRLVSRQQKFLDLAGSFAPACRAPYWNADILSRGLTVRMVGLNTALLCKDDSDQGKLCLGMAQAHLLDSLRNGTSRGPEVALVLAHHPYGQGWLRDEREVEPWIRRSAHVYLSGHVHCADSESRRKGSGTGLLNVVAGAVHGDPGQSGATTSHGYNYGSVVADSAGRLTVVIKPLRWSSKNADFRPDVDNTVGGGEYSEPHVIG